LGNLGTVSWNWVSVQKICRILFQLILFHPTRLDEGKSKTRGETDLRKVICEKTNLVPCVHRSWVLISFPVWANLIWFLVFIHLEFSFCCQFRPNWGRNWVPLVPSLGYFTDNSPVWSEVSRRSFNCWKKLPYKTKSLLMLCSCPETMIWISRLTSGKLLSLKNLAIAGPVKLGHNDEF